MIVIKYFRIMSLFLLKLLGEKIIPISFIGSSVKSSRLYPFLILNVILFSILFVYILMDYQYSVHAFLKCIQNNIEYLRQNMIHQVIEIYHFMLEQIFQICCYCMSFLCFLMSNKILRFDRAILFSPLLESNLSVNLSIKTCGLEVWLFFEFINIVSIFIIECNFIECNFIVSS